MEEIKPDVIVSRTENLSFFKEDDAENIYFMSVMRRDFKLVYQNPAANIFIWARRQ